MHEDIVLTPMMKQFLDLKAKHPDAVMLFRCGDFYETYSTDAVVASEILGITLTKRANGKGKTIEMAGFPHHALDTYLPKLIRAGKRVAICDQLEDPKLAKKLVKRGITELVTPGVAINDNVLSYKENNFRLCEWILPTGERQKITESIKNIVVNQESVFILTFSHQLLVRKEGCVFEPCDYKKNIEWLSISGYKEGLLIGHATEG